MQYILKIAKSFSILILVLIILVVANNNNNISLPIVILKEARADTAYFTRYNSLDTTTAAIITYVQLPGIIPNNNNNNAPSSTFPTSPPASPSALPPPPPIIHNTSSDRLGKQYENTIFMGDVDKFGISEIYPTKPGGEEWFMNMQDPAKDPRFNPQATITKNPDGSYKVTKTAVRMEVYPSTGYHQDKITTLNQKELAAKGYMQSPNDWKNVEMTGYVKLISSPSDDQFNWYNRGGRHTYTTPCEGTAYKSDVMYYFSGKTRFNKEQWYNNGYSFTSPKTVTRSIQDKWVGLKYIVYNFQQQNGNKTTTAVRLQSWFDTNNNGIWVKINDFVDSGGWGNHGGYCGGIPDQIITWGGPIATFRWDTATDVDFKNFSVREIEPPPAQ